MTPLGAHVEGDGIHFAAFTDAGSCAVELVDPEGTLLFRQELEPLGGGYFTGTVSGFGSGALYWLVVGERRLPDPYARYLPRGVHGPAQVVAPRYAFKHLPPQRRLAEQVIYELHVGTFTDEGTFAAARRRLPDLVELGITTVQLMPVAAFAGERGWGYDGVALFAPHATYGTVDDLRELVDAAHGLGLSVLLDVVYNHFGPSGNYLSAYSSRYFSENVHNAWGQAPNFSEPVMRQLVLDNARYWLREMGFDGLRLDATHAIIDLSPRHILAELADVAHELTPRQLITAEDERNDAALVTDLGLDALWADDFHHQVRATLTGERESYYAAYEPGLQGLAEVINRGWLYVGQKSPLSGKPRGTSAQALPAEALVYCIQNHDQIGNRAFGDRFESGEVFRSASLLLLFLPMTPLLFMGQEWGASSPFLYFTDHEPELGRQVTAGRHREFEGFPEFADPVQREKIPDPQAHGTFADSKLCWAEREEPEHAATLTLYRAALALRKTDKVLSGSGRERLRAFTEEGVLYVERWRGVERRVLVLNQHHPELTLERLASRLQLQDAHVLLQSSREAASALPRGSALLLAGMGQPTHMVEEAR